MYTVKWGRRICTHVREVLKVKASAIKRCPLYTIGTRKVSAMQSSF